LWAGLLSGLHYEEENVNEHIRRNSGIVLAAFLVLCVAVFAVRVPVAGAEGGALLRAGIAKIDITPDKPVLMSGYASRKELSAGVHDHLYARIVAFESGGQRLVLVSTDLIGLYNAFEPLRDAIGKRYGLKPQEVFLSSTHTHSGPTPLVHDGENASNVEYTNGLIAKLLDAVGQAIEHQEAVQFGVGRGYSAVGMNRREKKADGSVKLGRNPYGPTDKEVLVLKLMKQDGTPLAALFDYATHGTSLGPKNLQISGDVLGLAAQFAEKILAPSVTAAPFAGASGDIDPWYRVLPGFRTENGWVPEPELLGTLLGEEVVHVFGGTQATETQAEIRTAFATLDLPAKKGEGNQGAQALQTMPLNVTVARIGKVGFVAVGCELLTEVGMAIKSGSPFGETFVITHCNGHAGYLAPAPLHAEGGYEVGSSHFAPEAADMLVKRAVEMLQGLK
jgi:hypothetical protein